MLKYISSFYWILFVIVSGAVFAATDSRPESFLTSHNLLHLIGWALVPRIMFFFFSAITGGFFFWLGVIFFPRLMVAYWATVYYGDTNLFFVIIAWIFALTGELSEKWFIRRSAT